MLAHSNFSPQQQKSKKNTFQKVKFSSQKCALWYPVIFLSPREGKFIQKDNQLFSWLKKEGKTEASACLMAGRSAL